MAQLTPFDARWMRFAVLGASVIALAVSSAVAWREFAPRSRSPRIGIRDWDVMVSTGHRIGPANPQLTIVEFTDFECPACKAVAPTLLAIQRADSSRIALVIKHFPLERRHPSARAAALAAICAARSGRFVAFQEATFESQDTLARVDWSAMPARRTALDSSRFAECRSSAETSRHLERDVLQGEKIGVQGTPHLLFNGRRFAGPLTEDRLNNEVLSLLGRSR